jgi:hypothetical protein
MTAKKRKAAGKGTLRPLVRCDRCRFWDWSDGQTGDCHGGPPGNKENENGDMIAAWPQTWFDDWCGSFQRTPNATAHVRDRSEAEGT